MKVTLLNHSENPERMVALAARVCYDKEGDIEKIVETLTPENVDKFVKHMLSLPQHGTPFESPVFTFGIEGISRSCSHQLVRHRIASIDQRSQRYCNEAMFDYVTPNSIANNEEAKDIFDKTMNVIQASYDTLTTKYNIPKEDARAVLPNACCTSLVLTMNLRSLYHFFNLRCCTRCQSELREVAYRMLVLCKEVSPLLFSKAGASCDTLGYCPEGKMTCGRKPTLDKLGVKNG